MSCSSDRGRAGGRRLRALGGLIGAGAGIAVALATAFPGCATKDSEPERAPLTERERDSTLGASGLPGSAGVSRALAVSDSAAARAARSLPEGY